MIFIIQTDDEVAGLEITQALNDPGIKHTILSKQRDENILPYFERNQAIIDLLDEALVKIKLDPNDYTVAGKIDMLVKYAQQGAQS